MKYYLCIIGNFEESSTIYKECIERQIYQYHETTRQKGPARNIKPGDILILVAGKQLKGYGIAENRPEISHGGHDEHWYTVHLKDGWRQVEHAFPLPYGVYWHTVRGTKQSIVKEMETPWAIEIIQKLKRRRHENSEEMAFPVHLSELATGLNSKEPFYDIPKIQRGLVWNATRCEVLWNSILRGIPIGAISLRPTDDGRWEIFDGQQRANTIALGYLPWPKQDANGENKPILWIDLNPKDTKDRKYVFRMTTPPHPWGYKLSNDEKTDNRLEVSRQREATKALSTCWELCGEQGTRPYTRELWPVDAGLPVPFSVLREYVEKRDKEGRIEYSSFVEYCIATFSNPASYHNCNWLSVVQQPEMSTPERWEETIDAIKKLSEYVVVALNCKTLPDDLGLYFKRMNKQGIEPDDEEIQYSLLKSKIPALKELDTLAEKRTRPSWLANIAVRFWLSRQENGKWHGSVTNKDIFTIGQQEQNFTHFIRDDFPHLLARLDSILKESENGLLSWHVSELYHYGHGEGLVLYFLREISSGHSCAHFLAIATTLLWFSFNTNKCAELLWTVPNIQTALFQAINEGHLARIFYPNEIQSWANSIQDKLRTNDWGDGNSVLQDPYISDALGCIWNGFDGKRGCSFLLYACRKFVREYFGRYKPFSKEWGEQNRPWDYDHILPKDWGPGNRISNYSYLVKKFLWSIGNSAPLPFSLNRSKNANAPNHYPDGCPRSASNLHVDSQEVDLFGTKMKNLDRLDRDRDASVHFIKTTLARIQLMIQDWYDNCHINELISFDNCDNMRRQFFELLQGRLTSCCGVETAKIPIWFVHGERQYPVHGSLDWARPWLVCGMSGTVQHEGKHLHCILGVASAGKQLEVGIRRHPDVNDMPGGEWWLQCSTYGDLASKGADEIAQELLAKAKEYSFVPD